MKEEKGKNKRNVPNLRFPGFEGEWEETNLGNCSTSLEYGMNSAAIDYDGENKYIRITDIDENSSRYKSEAPVSPEGMLLDKYLVQGNDILFARTGASTGKTYLYDPTDGKLYFAGFLIRARVKKTYNATFIFAQTQTEKYDKWVKLMSMRSGQPGINSQEYSSLSLNLPLKLEQDKIALFLSQINARIQTQSKIIEKLKSLIKCLTNQIFDRKLRFGAFQEEWRNFNVGDILEFFPTNSLAWENLDYSAGNVRNLHYGSIHKHSKTGLDLANDILPFIKSESFSEKFTLCKEGDVLFADASEDLADVAKAIEVINLNKEKLVGGLHTIHGRDKKDLSVTGFKGYAFSSRFFRNQTKKLSQGTKVYSFSVKNFKECSINFPEKPEQYKIVGILSSLEKKSEIEIIHLSNLKKQKEFLLKQLFI